MLNSLNNLHSHDPPSNTCTNLEETQGLLRFRSPRKLTVAFAWVLSKLLPSHNLGERKEISLLSSRKKVKNIAVQRCTALLQGSFSTGFYFYVLFLSTQFRNWKVESDSINSTFNNNLDLVCHIRCVLPCVLIFFFFFLLIFSFG